MKVSYSTTPNVPVKLFVNIAYTVKVIRAVVKNIPNIYFIAKEYCKSVKLACLYLSAIWWTILVKIYLLNTLIITTVIIPTATPAGCFSSIKVVFI
jgi:hypothetical protein